MLNLPVIITLTSCPATIFQPTIEMSYNERYYRRHREDYHEWEKRLAADFFTRYKVRSVVDLGCGVGSYLDAAYELGMAPIKGYEINLHLASCHVPKHLLPFISSGDVTLPLSGGGFDCSWSVEVGEHLDPQGTEQFVSNLVRLTDRLTLLTCAPPGQRGTAHINLRPKEEWIGRMTKNGMRYLPDEVERTVSHWRPLGAPNYILRNLMVFSK